MNIRSTQSFTSFEDPDTGLLFDESDHEKYPLRYYHIIDGEGLKVDPDNTYFVFVYEGEATLKIPTGLVSVLVSNTYYSVHGDHCLSGKFKAIAIEVIVGRGYYGETGYRAYTTIGGRVESKGRLKYIDGCTDSLLIHPVKKGDPCLNHLHFPKNIKQTAHTHPSHRIGLVIRGRGECVTPFGNLPLNVGNIFVIKEYNGEGVSEGLDGKMYPNGTHKFDTEDSHMDVIAFHPDSDFGAEDEFHPMINRTIVDGKSAREIEEIRTK